MPQYNHLNLAETYGRGVRDREAREYNALQRDLMQERSDRQGVIDEQNALLFEQGQEDRKAEQAAAAQETEKTRIRENDEWLMHSAEMLAEMPETHFEAAKQAFWDEGKRRGVWEGDMPNRPLTREHLLDLHHRARVELGAPEVRPNTTAKIQNFEHYQGLSKEQRSIWDQANTTPKIATVAGEKTVVHGGTTDKLSTLDEETEAAKALAGAKTAGQLKAKDEADSGKRVDAALTGVGKVLNVGVALGTAMGSTDNWSAGWGSLLKDIPATDAKRLDTALTTVKANLGFEALQEMRRNSPTGGALGQVAVQELISLQATVAALDQALSPEDLKANLMVVAQQYERWQAAYENAIITEGTPEQYQEYWDMIPSGRTVMAPDGTKRVKP